MYKGHGGHAREGNYNREGLLVRRDMYEKGT